MAAGSRSLLVVGRGEQAERLCALAAGAGWDALAADSFARARFVLAGSACDVVVVHDSLAGPDWNDGLAWLAGQVAAPLVASFSEEVVLTGLGHGVLWLPREAVERCPAVLAALLDQADTIGRERRHAAQTRTALAEGEAHVRRLLDMLWETAPAAGPSRWFSQRYLLDRLEEEVERSRRLGTPLSVVLGEMAPPPGQALPPEQANELAAWLAGRVARDTRRCDVAGHYGLHGFLMLLPQTTPEQAAGACRRLRDVLAHPPHELTAVYACFGLAGLPTTRPAEEASAPALLRRAEEHLDRARSRPDGGIVGD
jgi:GGDEF domain-containing protein